jgi:glutathione S-transferase
MASLKLFADRRGHPSRMCILFFQLNKIQFEEIHVKLLKGEFRTNTELPLQAIPVLKVTNAENHQNHQLILSQSTTILRYCAQKIPNIPENWYYPANLEKRAKVDEFMDFFHYSMNAVRLKQKQTMFSYDKCVVNNLKNATTRSGILA